MLISSTSHSDHGDHVMCRAKSDHENGGGNGEESQMRTTRGYTYSSDHSTRVRIRYTDEHGIEECVKDRNHWWSCTTHVHLNRSVSRDGEAMFSITWNVDTEWNVDSSVLTVSK